MLIATALLCTAAGGFIGWFAGFNAKLTALEDREAQRQERMVDAIRKQHQLERELRTKEWGY